MRCEGPSIFRSILLSVDVVDCFNQVYGVMFFFAFGIWLMMKFLYLHALQCPRSYVEARYQLPNYELLLNWPDVSPNVKNGIPLPDTNKSTFRALEEALSAFMSTSSFDKPLKPFCLQKSCLPEQAVMHTVSLFSLRLGFTMSLPYILSDPKCAH